jgi:outer membrane protein
VASRFAGAAFAAALAVAATPTRAQVDEPWPKGGGGPSLLFGWSLSNVRVGAHVEPDYLGSDDYRVTPNLAVTLSRVGSQPTFSAPDDGVSIVLVGNRRLGAGLAGRGRPARNDHHDLRGFETVDWTLEAGGFVNWWPVEWLRLRGEVRHGFFGHDSWIADVGADAVYVNEAWIVSLGPRLRWADDDFTRTYFEVTPLDAARSPLDIQPYRPDNAFSSAGVLASAERRVGRHWSIAADAGYRRLFGDAADSPIVEDFGSRNQFSGTLGVRYLF